MIQVAPDIVQYPLNSDISSDSCSAIEVRSKRNKRMRDRDIFLPHKRGEYSKAHLYDIQIKGFTLMHRRLYIVA